MYKTKTAIITGSYKGIGRCIALKLAQNGFNTVINYRNNSAVEAAEAVADKCRACGVKSAVFHADVSMEAECEALVSFAADRFGSVDVLVNNAGIVSYKLFTSVKEDDYRKLIACDQDSVFFMMKHAAKLMKKQRSGRIINIASMAGVNGFAGGVIYSAAKGAVIAMTKAASKELSGRGITVNAVAPGMIDTNLDAVVDPNQTEKILDNIGMGRYGTPDEVAGAVMYLASEAATYTTGAVIEIHGSMLS